MIVHKIYFTLWCLEKKYFNISFFVPRNVVVIADLIYKMQRKINKVESQVESPEETRKKYDVVTRKCQETSEIITHLDENVKELKIGVNKGNRNYKYTKDYFITLLNYNFSKILEFRQYKVIINNFVGMYYSCKISGICRY